jgi:hypothetical protein
MFLLKRDAGMTCAAIARKSGDRDPSGVSKICKKVLIEYETGKMGKEIGAIENAYIQK